MAKTYHSLEFDNAVANHGRPFGCFEKGRQLPYGFSLDQWFKGPPIDPRFDERPPWLLAKSGK